jgi:galactokinase
VNGRLLADRLVMAGLDACELDAKSALYDSALNTFKQSSGALPHHAYWIPGRLEVFGTHTDYAGGRVLVSALPRGFAFLAAPRPDDQLHVVDAVTGESLTIDTRAPISPLSGWRRYVQVVFARLARNFPGAPLAAEVVFASDLPRAAGMSSSSALMVGVATALVRRSGIRHSPGWLANIEGPVDEAGYFGCIENGRPFRGLAGDAGVGTHGGSEDHAAMVCGAAGMLDAYAFLPMRHVASVPLPDTWKIVVASSGVAAEKTGAALHSYNRLARGAAVLLDLWNRSREPAASLASALGNDPSAERTLHTIAGETQVDEWTPDALEARLQHFVREDARIPQALRAFANRDAAAVGALAAASQVDSENLLDNQVNETVALTRIAVECGALAARSFGAGFGGSVWAMIEAGKAPAFLSRWSEAYRVAHPRPRAAFFVAQPAPAARELANPLRSDA